MENSLQLGGKERAFDAPETCDPLSQDEFLNYKHHWSWFMHTLQQLFSQYDSNHNESEAFHFRLSYNAKTHSSVLRRKPVAMQTRVALL